MELEVFGPRVGLFPLPVISPIIPNVSSLLKHILFTSFFLSAHFAIAEEYFMTWQGDGGSWAYNPNRDYWKYKVYLQSSSTVSEGIITSSIFLNKQFMGNVKLFSQKHTKDGFVKVNQKFMEEFNPNKKGTVLNKTKQIVREHQKMFNMGIPIGPKQDENYKTLKNIPSFKLIMDSSEECPYQITTSFMDLVKSCNIQEFTFAIPSSNIWANQ